MRIVKSISAWIEQHRNIILFVYMILFSLGIIYTIWAVSRFLAFTPIKPLPGVIYYIHETQVKLICYALCVPALFVCWFLFACCCYGFTILGDWWKRFDISVKGMLLQLLYGGLLVVLIFQLKNLPLLSLVALCAFWFPFYRISFCSYLFRKSVVLNGGLCLLLLLFCMAFLPFVLEPLYVGAEYQGISTVYKPWAQPSHTILSQAILDKPLKKSNQYCFQGKNLDSLLSLSQNSMQDLVLDGKRLSYYIYKQDTNIYCLMRAMPANMRFALEGKLPANIWKKINQYSNELEQRHTATLLNLSQPHYKQFLEDSRYQFEWQTLSRGFIHHHNHLFGMAYQFVLGRPIQEIFMQYGWLQTIGLGTVLKKLNRVDYSSYVHLYYSFYFLYFFAFLWVIRKLLQDKKYILFGGFLALAGWLNQTYLYLYLGPGTNPIRYLMYLFVLLNFTGYIRSRHFAYAVMSIISAWIGILINTQFGLFMVVSLTGTWIFKLWEERKDSLVRDVSGILLLWIGVVALLKIVLITPDPISLYFFSGLLAFGFSYSSLIFFFLWTVLCYGLLIWRGKKNRILSYALLYMTFFSQGMYLYYLRSAGFYHFCAISSIFVFQGMLFLYILEENIQWRWVKKILFLGVCCAACIFLVRGEKSFLRSKRGIQKYFATHQLYHWSLPGTNFISTMNPDDFLSSIELIKKYSPEEKGIYIISQYDNFLPFLSQRYSKLPFIDLQWYLITQKEFDRTLECIRTHKPQYLFVDTQQQQLLNDNIIPGDYPVIAYLHNESLWRASRMMVLRHLFEYIAPDYEPVEQTPLLQVYRRKK